MSMALVRLGCTLPFMTASAIALSVCSGMGGCVCPNSSSMILMYPLGCDYFRRTAMLPIDGRALFWNKLFQTVSFVFSDQYCVFFATPSFFEQWIHRHTDISSLN